MPHILRDAIVKKSSPFSSNATKSNNITANFTSVYFMFCAFSELVVGPSRFAHMRSVNSEMGCKYFQ